MPGRAIKNDATIADIVVMGKLNKPEEYVRKVFENMLDCERKFGTASLRIAVTGEAKAPNYRIEYQRHNGREPGCFACYRGLGHRPFDDIGDRIPGQQMRLVDLDDLDDIDRTAARYAAEFEAELSERASELKKRPVSAETDRTFDEPHWSTKETSLDEVKQLLGKLRQRKR
jgi:hypothetical protein